MLHKVRNARREILKSLPELKNLLPRGERIRSKLQKMAKRGEPRPSQKTPIGRSLSQYTSPSSTAYKKEFHREMKRIRPDWFVSQKEKTQEKKKILLDMARKGLPRPSHDKTRLGQALSNYTRKSSHVYDPEFDKTIRTLRPDWFTVQSNARPSFANPKIRLQSMRASSDAPRHISTRSFLFHQKD